MEPAWKRFRLTIRSTRRHPRERRVNSGRACGCLPSCPPPRLNGHRIPRHDPTSTLAHPMITASLPRQMLLVLCILAATSAVSAQTRPLPSGILNFAGRLAHDHWHLFGEARREELGALNRELREAERQLRESGDDAAKREASDRGWRAVDRLREVLRGCPQLLRVDLSQASMIGWPEDPVEQPGDTGALLFEVVTGGDGLSFSASGADLAQPGGESSRVAVDLGARGLTYVVAGLEHLPVGRTMLQLEFNRPGQAAVVRASGGDHPVARPTQAHDTLR